MDEEMNLLKIELLEDNKVVMETLNRIGIANKQKRILYPSCYLHEIDGETYLVHFKQMFLLTRDNSYKNISDDDLVRRNAIAFCLKNWGLIDVPDEDIEPHNKYIFVLPHREKNEWRIYHKFNFRNLNK